MRILQLISSSGYYGAEAVVLNLSKCLRNFGCDVHLGSFLNSQSPNTELADRARALAFPVRVVPCKGKMDWSTVRAIREYVLEESIDVVHAHGYKADLYGYLAVRKTSIAIMSTCHLWPKEDVRISIYSVIDRLVLRCFGHVVAVSEEISADLHKLGVSPKKTSVIDNGIDVSPFRSAAPSLRRDLKAGSRPIVGLVGRLTLQKGPDYFLQAASKVLRAMPEALFVFIGDGPERSMLEVMAQSLNIQDNVVFAGRREDMPGVYASLDLLVLPSREEGLPITILEGLASGNPVIATNVGAVPKLIKTGETGVLLEPGDVEGLKEAILALLKDADLRAAYAEAGRRLVMDRHSAESMSEKYLRLYSRLCSAHAPLVAQRVSN